MMSHSMQFLTAACLTSIQNSEISWIQFKKIFNQFLNVGINQGYADTKQVSPKEYRFDD